MTGSSGVTYRPAVDDDLGAAARIIRLALDDLTAKQGRAPAEGAYDRVAPDVMTPVLRYLAGHDPDRFWVAEAQGHVVGFGAGLLRDDLRYLAGLFVLPEWQGQGVGRELLKRAMAAPAGGGITAVLSSGANTISNGLYARHGMFPLLPALCLMGNPSAGAAAAPSLGSLAPAALQADDLDDLGAIDRSVTQVDRRSDHVWLLGEVRRQAWLFRRRGRPVGYAYLGGDGTEGLDYVGPVAAVREADVRSIIGFALAQCTGMNTVTLMVPGPNLEAQRLLWRAGFVMAGPTGLLGASRPFGRFNRYLFAGNSLM